MIPHPIPNLDDITHKLNGSTLYGKLDAYSGYWNVKLTKGSSMLITFNSNTTHLIFMKFTLSIKEGM